MIVIIPILQMGKLGHREALVQSLTASGQQHRQSNQAARRQSHTPNHHTSDSQT